jgi:hypothetical protein
MHRSENNTASDKVTYMTVLDNASHCNCKIVANHTLQVSAIQKVDTAPGASGLEEGYVISACHNIN